MNRSKEITDAMKNFYDRWSAGDVSFINDFLSKQDDIVFVGTDPDEWWQGRDGIYKIWSTQFKEMSGMTITSGRLSAYANGDVGWAIDNPKLRMPDGTQASLRMTCVFERESGDWRLVHGHASVGVPNEEVIGQELTTSPD